jgi:hypothetical protein
MVWMTREERQLKGLMALSAFVYFVAGLAFALVPAWVLTGINRVSRLVAPGLPEIPLQAERFWLALAFSMMMTIAALSYATYVNVRRNRGFVVALLVSKLASSASAMCFFYLTARHFAYLVITAVDAQIFLITLLFYLRANRAIMRARKEYQRKRIVVPKSTGPATVVAHKGEDRFELLDRVLKQSGFYEVLEERHLVSGKSKDEFSVAIKPNFMFARHKKDISAYTDPALVEALVDRICARGFKNVSIVESRNTLGNYYKNRQVVTGTGTTASWTSPGRWRPTTTAAGSAGTMQAPPGGTRTSGCPLPRTRRMCSATTALRWKTSTAPSRCRTSSGNTTRSESTTGPP